MGQVIEMQEVDRKTLTSSYDEVVEQALSKGIWLGDSLRNCRQEDRKRAVRNWVEAGKLTEHEARLVARVYGWGRD